MLRRMPFEVFLGLRYLRARGHRTNLSLFVWIGIGGVFLGVSALIVVLAVMTGFQDGIRDKIISANPHVLIMEAGGRGVADGGAPRRAGGAGTRRASPPRPSCSSRRCSPRRAGAPPAGSCAGWTSPPPRCATRSRRRSASAASSRCSRARSPPSSWAASWRGRLGVAPGDHVTVISPQGAMTAVGLVPKMRRFLVAGCVEVGMYEYDASLAYTVAGRRPGVRGPGRPRDRRGGEARQSLRRQGRGPDHRRASWRAYWIRDWMDMNRNLFAALQLEKLALFVIVTIIVLVAAFAIIGHLVLLVAEKRKEIGILKAMGAGAGSIGTVFLVAGMLIGLVGTVAGSAFGLLLIWVQNTYKIIRLAGDVYQISYLPMKLTGSDFAMIVGSTLVISFLATLSPARRAARMDPIEVLRYE